MTRTQQHNRELVRKWLAKRPFCVGDRVRWGELDAIVRALSPSGRILTLVTEAGTAMLVGAQYVERVMEAAE